MGKYRFLILALLVLALFAVGCRRNAPPSAYTEILQGYVGTPIEGMVANFGVPDAYFRSETGTIYEWEQRERVVGVYQSYLRECTTRATVDREGIIRSTTWKGNACGLL